MKKELVYVVCVLWVLIDQLIKLMIKINFNLYDKLVIIKNFFKIEYVQNDGGAFSMFSGMGIILVIISVIAFIALVTHIKNSKINSMIEIISFGMIMGGILGNLIDRVVYGKVIDYLSFKIFGYDFAVFNFADIGIVLGIILIIIYYIGVGINESKSRRRENKN